MVESLSTMKCRSQACLTHESASSHCWVEVALGDRHKFGARSGMPEPSETGEEYSPVALVM